MTRHPLPDIKPMIKPALLGTLALAALFFLQSKTKAGTTQFEFYSDQIAKTYFSSWTRFQVKLEHLQKIDEKYAQMELANVTIKQELETLKFKKETEHAVEGTQRFNKHLKQETGTEVGRNLASISYKVPHDLTSPQLYTLGLTYLKAEEDEKAAVIFSALISEDTYRVAMNFLILGILWYRLDNLALSNQNFDSVLKMPERDESVRYQAQARLWKALIAKRLNNDHKAQFWLKDLIDNHPHSLEASWVNHIGDGR